MKLWILLPINPRAEGSAWRPWYDKCFGMVLRAPTEADARELADRKACDENRSYESEIPPHEGRNRHPWTDPKQSTCVELQADGPAAVIMQDVHSA